MGLNNCVQHLVSLRAACQFGAVVDGLTLSFANAFVRLWKRFRSVRNTCNEL